MCAAGKSPNVLYQQEARITYRENTDPRRYNNPTTTGEIAVILPGDGISDYSREIIVQYKGGSFKELNETQPAYCPLHYVLFFPYGELGYHKNIPYTFVQNHHKVQNMNSDVPPDREGRVRKTVSYMEWISY